MYAKYAQQKARKGSMKVGILHDFKKYGGGGYQYSLSVISALMTTNEHEYLIFCKDDEEFLHELEAIKPIFIGQEENLPFKLCSAALSLLNLRFPLGKYRVIKDIKPSLLICPIPTLVGYSLKIPYIVTIHDLMHKFYPNFPEYSFRSRISRDIIYSKSARNAIFSIVDSEQGKEDLIHFYNIPEDKIKIISLIPPPYVYKYKDIEQTVVEELLSKYDLPDNFIFYPAQFWSHKNHIRLLKALHLIRKEHDAEIHIVFVGSPKEMFNKVMSLIKELKMDEQVHYGGYSSNKELVALYKKAIALVYPSLAGPTNIPILESLVLGTPVVCSNLFSMPEQVGDAGLLFDPFDIEDMAEKIYKIWIDENLRKELTKKGYERVRNKNLTIENYAKKWEAVIEEALEIVKK